MSRPSRQFVVGAALVAIAGLALIVAVRAAMTMGGTEVPRPATEGLAGTWQRTAESPRESAPQADPWSRLAEVASFAIDEPGPGRVTMRLQDASEIVGQVRLAQGATMVVAMPDGGAVTIGRLGAHGTVVMASGSSMVSFQPGE